MPANPSVTFPNQVLQPQSPTGDAVQGVVNLPGLVDYPAGQVLGLITSTTTARNEVHHITIPSAVNGGTFRLLYGTDLTASVAWDGDPTVIAAALQTALVGLDPIATGDVAVVGTEASDGVQTIAITYQGNLANRAIPAPTLIQSLTGGTATIARQTTGHSGPGLASAYADGNSDGTQTAKCVLLRRTRTDLAGRILDERPGAAEKYSAAVYTKGFFRCADLVDLDDNAVTDLGKLVNANSRTQAGAILFIR